jgi:hypothetical protein
MESKRYRLQASLSDLNGFDAHIHGGTPTGVLTALTNAFVRSGAQPTVAELRGLYRALGRFWADVKGRGRLSLFSPRGFRDVVTAALQIAERLAVI